MKTPSSIRSLCVYCGSSAGNADIYGEASRLMAKTLVARDIALVYGGGCVGLMGIIANEMLALGGKVTGVIPRALLDKEVGHQDLTHMIVVRDMHERKATMARLSDGFIAMPGGIGTLEELFEALTWSQLGFHRKPVGLLNVAGFYDGLIAFVRHLVDTGFLKKDQATLLLHASDPLQLLSLFDAHRPESHRRLLDSATATTILP